jgi:hypothetical protein
MAVNFLLAFTPAMLVYEYFTKQASHSRLQTEKRLTDVAFFSKATRTGSLFSANYLPPFSRPNKTKSWVMNATIVIAHA